MNRKGSAPSTVARPLSVAAMSAAPMGAGFYTMARMGRRGPCPWVKPRHLQWRLVRGLRPRASDFRENAQQALATSLNSREVRGPRPTEAPLNRTALGLICTSLDAQVR